MYSRSQPRSNWWFKQLQLQCIGARTPKVWDSIPHGYSAFFSLSHARNETKKQNIFLWLQFSLTMSPHCGSLLSMVTGHFIGLLQIIIATDYIISLSNPVCKNCQETANFEIFCFVLSLNMQKVLSLSNSNSFFSYLATYNSISRKLRQTDIWQ